MYRAMEGFGTRSTTIPLGDAGIAKTLEVMRRLADEGSRDLEVRAAALRAIQDAGAQSHDPFGQVDALFRRVRDGIFFLNDPTTTELLQSPRYTLAFGAGDCDDRAILLAAMLMAIGVPAQFRVVALDRRTPQAFSHVYVVANVMGRPMPLDPTYAQNLAGFDPARFATRVQTVAA